ncbi:MAG: hypothetical protein LH660_22270 [Phormidesmis sp. CAN_BIN36]|nr:hypothetical protein [Phormidesmis sp. CAN_BIN36]
MNCQIRPHPSPLPKGEGTGFLAPFSSGRRVGEGFAPLREEGNSYLHPAPRNQNRDSKGVRCHPFLKHEAQKKLDARAESL